MTEFFNTLQEFPFVGDTSIIVIVLILVLTGRLVPRRYLEDIIRERDAWHEAYEAERAVSLEIRSQNAKLLEVNKVTEHLLTSFKQRSDAP